MTETRTRRGTALAAALLAFALAEVATAAIAGALSGISYAELEDLLVPSNALLGLFLAVAGWPIAMYRPRNPVGWLLLAGGCAYASTGAGIPLLALVADAGWAGNPAWRLVATVADGGWTWAVTLCLPAAMLYFPDGRPLGPRWRWLLWVAAADGLLAFAVGALFGFTTVVGGRGYLFTTAVHTGPWGLLGPLSFGPIPIIYIAALVNIVVRYRRGDERLRRQLLWVLLAFLVVVVVFALDPVLPDSIFSILVIALVPIAVLIAIFRYGLLDIRRVFSRSLLYVLLTGLAIGAYLAVVGLLGPLAAGGRGIGPALAATLVVAAAFNPARVWLQRQIDRVVYGARRDPVRALEAVGERLGDAGPDAGLDGVLEALCRVMRLPTAVIVAGGEPIARAGHEPALATRRFPLRRGDEALGELVIGLRDGETRLAAADERVLTLLAAPIAVAVHVTRMAAELTRSREQVISAREEERRRLRRDLHDGLGPVLTGVVLRAEAALRLVRADPDRSEGLIGDLRDQTTGALQDIRRLVYELRPPALDSLGLVGALREYAMVLSRRADGAPLAVTVDADEPLPDLPAAVEVAAYRIVTEALTNVVRHSSADAAQVRLAAGSGELHVAVHDDGTNAGSGPSAGVGLTSIRERAAELGGRCAIELDRTGGRIDVWLPTPATATPAAAPADILAGEVEA